MVTLPMSALRTLEPLQMLFVTVIYSLIVLGVLYLMSKSLPKKYFEINKGKMIAAVVIFLISFVSKTYQLLISMKFNVITTINLLIGSAVNFIALFLLISSFVSLYGIIKKKEAAKKKKEFILSIVILLFFNGWMLNFLLLILMIMANILLFG